MDTVDKQHKQNERKPKRGRRTNFATDLLTKKDIGGNSLSISCTLCSKAIHLDDFAEFLKKPLEDRRNSIKEKGLCFGCYSLEHVAKHCRNKRSCKTCNRRQPTSLHDYNWRPERKNAQHKESEMVKEDQVINANTTVFNVTEAGDVPITMGIVPIWLYHKNNSSNRICVYALLDNASGGTFIKEDLLRNLEWKELKANSRSPLCMAPKK